MVKQVLKPIKKLHTVDWAGDGDVVPWHKSHDITDRAAPVMSVVTYAAVSLNGQRCPCPVHFVPTPWVSLIAHCPKGVWCAQGVAPKEVRCIGRGYTVLIFFLRF